MNDSRPRTGYITQVVKSILRSAGISGPPIDLRRVANACGLAYEEVDYFPDNVDALIVTKDGKSIAVVNQNQSVTRRRFSLAHEIGHFVLHQDTAVLETAVSIDSPPEEGHRESGSLIECEANLFAGELLVPIAYLKSHFRPGMTAADIASLFEVSQSVASIAVGRHLRALFKL